MRKVHFLIVLIVLFITSCCEDPEEIDRFDLTQAELDLIPYELNQTIHFQHNNGFEFDFQVVENTLSWEEEHPFCESPCCNQGFYSYQSKSTVLSSVYPNFNIKFHINSGYRISQGFNNSHLSDLQISLNYDYFSILQSDSLAHFICDNTMIFYDSLVLNQRLFYDVIEAPLTKYQIFDTTLSRPKSILYNQQFGLLQIKTNKNESYTIK